MSWPQKRSLQRRVLIYSAKGGEEDVLAVYLGFIYSRQPIDAQFAIRIICDRVHTLMGFNFSNG